MVLPCLGTFTHVYPYKPGQIVVAGTGRIRIASDRAGPVTVRIVMPEDVDATVLPLNVYIVSDTLADPITDLLRDELQQIFTRAGIAVRGSAYAPVWGRTPLPGVVRWISFVLKR